jgi:hypothetical protein
MRYSKYFVLLGLLVVLSAGSAKAQVAVSVGVGPGYVGPAPICTYGYYGYYPYACAPYGFYGPEYFSGGLFIGAGPWFHGFGGPRFFGRPGFRRDFDGRGRVFGDRGGFRGRDDVHGNGRDFRGGARGPVGNGFRGGAVGRAPAGGGSRGGNSFHGGGMSRGGGRK